MKYRAKPVIEAFGGLSKTAAALGHKNVTTVQYWYENDTIPRWWIREIRDAAKKKGVKMPTDKQLRAGEAA